MGAALRWLEADRAAPFFAWVHFYDPHAPYAPPAEHDIFPKRDAASTHARWDEFERAHLSGADARGEHAAPAISGAAADTMATLSADLVSLYDGEIHYCDAQVARILATLDGMGVAENTLVIVTSDHGESLDENAYYFRHGWHLYDNVLRVPLIVRFPGRVAAGSVIDEQVELADVFGAICGAVPGLAREQDGRERGPRDLIALAGGKGAGPESAGAAAPSPRPARDFAYSETFLRKQLVGGQPQFSLRTPRWKYISMLRDAARGRRRLFDLASDPTESNNAAPADSARADSLEAALRAFVAAGESQSLAAGDANRVEPDEATLERLRALGYIR
jgi:arylsulfatase A-like enzyme